MFRKLADWRYWKIFWKVGEEFDRARMWAEGILRAERKGARTGHSNMCATLKGGVR